MSKYYVKAENSRGKLVTAAQPLMARAELLTLRKDVKSFNSSASVSSQTESVTVTLERALDGQLHLYVRYMCGEPVVLHTISGHKDNTLVLGY